MMWKYLVILVLCTCRPAFSKTPEEWKSRVIYQILTDRFAHSEQSPEEECSELYEYCGGTFKGIENNLDYITGLGANAIWISPFVENTELGFHGYWPKNIYEVNPNFGSSQDLKDLITACHDRDVWVMADLVLNHMGYQHGCHWSGCPVENTNNFTGYAPFDNEAHFHPYCEIDWSNEESENVQTCWLAFLPDLNQTNPDVHELLIDWVTSLTTDYGFDGYRLDFVKGISFDFWQDVDEAVDSYTIGEAYDGNTEKVASYQGPLDSVLSFPMYFTLESIYQWNDKEGMDKIHDQLALEATTYTDTTILGGFLDNHDRARFLSHNSDVTSLKNALVYLMMARWIPIIYYGTELGFDGGNDPQNRESMWPHFDTEHELYQFISAINTYRSSLGQTFINSEQEESVYDEKFYSFTRHETFVAITNEGSGSADITRTVTDSNFAEGTVLVNILDETDTVEVKDGQFEVTLTNGEPKIYGIDVTSSTSRLYANFLTAILLSSLVTLLSNFD